MALNLWKPEAKRRAGIVRPPVVPGLALSRYTNTELGVRIARRSNLPQQDPGVAWARLMHEANRPEKDVARDEVLRLFTVDQFPSLSILTFPASEWRFESELLTMREGAQQMAIGGPRNTRIVGIERDIAVFRAACHNIPQAPVRRHNAKKYTSSKRKRPNVRVLDAPVFASARVNSAKISDFFCCTFEDYAVGSPFGMFDAAWLDFNGQISAQRLGAIETFWNRQVRSLLVVTLLHGRAANQVERLTERLSDSRLESENYYGDGAPMCQVVFRRQSAESFERGRPSLKEGSDQ